MLEVRFMLFILKVFIAIIFAVSGAIAGNQWIIKLYRVKENILSFPHKIFSQHENRKRFLPGILGILMAFYLLSNNSIVPVQFFSLFFIYFLILFTFTDWEQQVIFDAMLLPFALLGLFSSVLTGLPVLNHLAAGLGGGLLFLVLAILTRGGIGGGDIKLIAALGLWLGSSQLLDVIVMGLIAGGIGAFLLLKFAHKKKTDTFAYGPFFTVAALLQLFVS